MGIAGAIRAGAAYIEMFLDDNKLARGLAAAQAKVQSWSSNLGKLGGSAYGGDLPGPLAAVARFAASPAGMFTGMLEAVREAAQSGDELVKLSEKAGVSVETISALGYAASRSDVSTEMLSTALKKMSVTIFDAANGSKEATDALDDVGLSLKDLKSLSPDEQFRLIADRISNIGNPTERAAMAVKLFGRAGADLLPLLMKGSTGIKALEDHARAMGMVRSTEAAEQQHEFNLALADMTSLAKGSVIAIGSALIPELRSAVEWLTKGAAAVRDWIKEHREVVFEVFRVSAAVVAGGVALKGMIAAITLLNGAFGLLLLNPVVAGLVGVAAVLAAVGIAADASYRKTAAAADQAASAVAGGDAQRQQAAAYMERLDELAGKESLLKQEQEEARQLIEKLQQSYGDLGLSVDAVTGRITGLAGAQGKLNAVMREQAMAQLQDEYSTLSAQLKAHRAKESGLFALGYSPEEGDRIRDQLMAVRRRINALQAGDKAALMGDDQGKARLPGAMGGGRGDRDARRKFEEELNRKLAEAAIHAIEDEEQRAIAATDRKWEAELDAAKKVGAEVTRIETAWLEERAAIKSKYDKKRADEATKLAKGNANLDEEVEKARINATMTGRGRDLALLEVEKAAALRDAADKGLDPTKIEDLYEWKKKALKHGGAMPIVGQFGGGQAWGLGGGGPLERIEANIAKLLGVEVEALKIHGETQKKLLLGQMFG